MTDPDSPLSRAYRRAVDVLERRDRVTALDARVRVLSRHLEAAVRALEAAAPIVPDPEWTDRGWSGLTGHDLRVVAADCKAALRGDAR